MGKATKDKNKIRDGKKKTIGINLNDTEKPPGNNNIFSQESMDKIRKEQQANKPRKPYKQRKTKKVVEHLTDAEKDIIIKPLFIFSNAILTNRGITPLNEQEINSGMEAFTPLIEYYFPKMDKYGMYIAPIMWTSSVVMVRLHEPKKVALKENNEIVEKINEEIRVNSYSPDKLYKEKR